MRLDLLTTLRDKGGKVILTRIMYKTNIHHTVLQNMISELSKTGLVRIYEERDQDRVYRKYEITDKGLTSIQNG